MINKLNGAKMDWKTYNWNIKDYMRQQQNTFTWEYDDQNIKDKNYGVWQPTKIPDNTIEAPVIPTEKSMIEDILQHSDDRGFFEDIVDWLKKDAPKKLSSVLHSLHYREKHRVTYEFMCEVVYKIGFRTSERLEQRMMLGPTNKWIQEYFKDFPSR